MNGELFCLWLNGLKQRKKAVISTCIIAFIAVFFVTGVLLFQENMREWQMALDKDRYGDWFVMETVPSGQEKELDSHPFLENAAQACTVCRLYDSEWNASEYKLGYMSDAFVRQGNITLEQGQMPQTDNEIVFEANVLHQMGYDAQIGDTITIYYYANDNSSDKQSSRQKEYILSGILKSYTNIWVSGKTLPGAVVNRAAYASLGTKADDIYIYPLKTGVETENYRQIYKNMAKGGNWKFSYNENVYDNQPWDAKSVYYYIYLAVMVVGIAALTYQLTAYQRGRRETYQKMRLMGAQKSQIGTIILMEDLILLLPSGILGVAAAGGLNKAVCMVLKLQQGLDFYYVNAAVYFKGVLAVVIAAVIEIIVTRVTVLFNKTRMGQRNPGKVRDTGKRKYKSIRFSHSNIDWHVHRCLIKSSGILQAIGVRIFFAGLTVVIVVCIVKIYSTCEIYEKSISHPDFVGYKEEKDDFYYAFPYLEEYSNQYTPSNASEIDTYENMMNSRVELTKEQVLEKKVYLGYYDLNTKHYINAMIFSIANSRYCKNGNTNLMKGLTRNEMDMVADVPGVETITYACFETERMWHWEGMNFDKMGGRKLSDREKAYGPKGEEKYKDTYLFATAYVEPSEKLYRRLSRYMEDSQIDYEAFCRGEQILLLLNKNPDGQYDDTLQTGETVSFQYYNLPLNTITNMLYTDVYPYDSKFSLLVNEKLYSNESKIAFLKSDAYGESWYKLNFEACVAPKIAGVVYLTDEIKKDLGDILIDYGYYTAIASTQLGTLACERQNQLMAEFLDMELPQELQYGLQYNQIAVNYNLSSVLLGTENALSVFGKQNGIKFVNYSEEKSILRTNVLNAFLQFGITLLAAVVIDLLVGAAVMKKRMEERKERLRILSRLGADRNRLCRICMLEPLRESVWCIFTAPLRLLIQYIICRRMLKKL